MIHIQLFIALLLPLFHCHYCVRSSFTIRNNVILGDATNLHFFTFTSRRHVVLFLYGRWRCGHAFTHIFDVRWGRKCGLKGNLFPAWIGYVLDVVINDKLNKLNVKSAGEKRRAATCECDFRCIPRTLSRTWKFVTKGCVPAAGRWPTEAARQLSGEKLLYERPSDCESHFPPTTVLLQTGPLRRSTCNKTFPSSRTEPLKTGGSAAAPFTEPAGKSREESINRRLSLQRGNNNTSVFVLFSLFVSFNGRSWAPVGITAYSFHCHV